MGYTTRVSDYDLAQATTVGPDVEGVEVGAGEKAAPAEKKSADKQVTTSKVVKDADEKPPVKKTTARTKAK